MSDKLVVGYQEFIKRVSAGLEEASVDHSCQDQDAVPYVDMAMSLWASGYRFDPEARAQWIVAELRAQLSPRSVELFNELLALMSAE